MTKKNQPREPLLLITWTDAGVVSQGDWMSRDEAMEQAKPEHFLNRTCGWLLHEDKTCVVIAGQVADDVKAPAYDLIMRIPKSLIKSRKVLAT